MAELKLRAGQRGAMILLDDEELAPDKEISLGEFDQGDGELLSDPISVTTFGARGDGITNDTAAIQAALNAAAAAGGGVVYMPPGTYKITTTLTVSSNVKLQGAGKSLTTIYMPAANFTNTAFGVGGYGATSVAIDCSGQTGSPYTPTVSITLCDFTIESEVSDGRHLYPILVRNSQVLKILDVEVFGIPAGNLITLDSVVIGEITGCQLHDCTSSNAGSQQLTGIETDNNRVNSVNCVSLHIHHNTIVNLQFSGAALPTPAMQTDGINTGVGSSHGHIIHDNYISDVGEGIDCFSSECTIHSNELIDCYVFGLKLIHGASRNHIYGNTIMRPGQAGLYAAGASTNATADNYWHHNLIHDVDANGIWGASASPAGIFVDVGAAFKVDNNTFRNNRITGGTSTMEYGIVVAEGDGNRFFDTEVEAWTTLYASDAGTNTVISNAKKTLVRASVGSLQATTSGNTVTVDYDVEQIDTQGEFDTTTNVFTATSHRRLRVYAQVLTSALSANTLSIRKNSTTAAVSFLGVNARMAQVVETLTVVPGDTIDVRFTQSTGNIDISNAGPEWSFMTIEEVSC